MRPWGAVLIGLLLAAAPAPDGRAGKKSAPALPALGRTVAGPVSVEVPDGGTHTLAIGHLVQVPLCLNVANTGVGVVSVTAPVQGTIFALGPGESSVFCTAGGVLPFLACASDGRKSRDCTATWRLDRYFGP